jgi:hypothetical protein
MSLWFVAFQGSTPIGGPIVGAAMGALGARAGLGLGTVTIGMVALAGFLVARRLRAGADPGKRGSSSPAVA